MDGEIIGRVELLGSLHHARSGDIADVAGDFVFRDFGSPHMLVELGLLGQPLPLRPRGLQIARAFDRGPFIFRDDGEEIALTHDLDDAGDVPDRAFVDALEFGSD